MVAQSLRIFWAVVGGAGDTAGGFGNERGPARCRSAPVVQPLPTVSASGAPALQLPTPVIGEDRVPSITLMSGAVPPPPLRPMFPLAPMFPPLGCSVAA